MTSSLSFAILATFLSALFFVGSKFLMARYEIPWLSLWRRTLTTTGILGFLWYLALGAPAVPWQWCLAAGIAGSLAHVASNQALSWGEASLLVPVSGAKPIALIALTPLLLARALPPGLAGACAMATAGIALSGIAPRRVHRHAPRPGLAFVLMGIATAMMAFSDVCGAAAVERAGNEHRLAVVALWLGFSGVPPLLTLPWARENLSRQNQVRTVALGLLYTVFVSSIALAFALSPDPRRAVAEVNIIVAFRGIVAVLMVLGLDRWFSARLEPIPKWIHAVRLSGAAVLASAVILAFRQ